MSTTPGQAVSVTYVDFLQANGIQCLPAESLGQPEQRVVASEVGEVQFVVRCSMSELNQRSQQMPPPPGDGNAGLLPAGTAVHAVDGWPPVCRLAAQHDGSWHVT
jgi:hypothetical protein